MEGGGWRVGWRYHGCVLSSLSTAHERHPQQFGDTRGVIWTVTLLFLVLALAVLVRTAWVCDDAYITFRVADNFVHGYGLRWNVDERVAVFTHPLWLFLFSSVYAITREAYYTAMFLGIGLTLITMLGVAVRVAPGAAAGALAVVALLSSKAFVDFSTSGLENPLTHLLLIVFVLQWARRDDGPRALVRLWGSAALALVNRLDLVLLVAPALAVATVMSARRIGRGAAIRAAIVGTTPLIAWMTFSIDLLRLSRSQYRVRQAGHRRVFPCAGETGPLFRGAWLPVRSGDSADDCGSSGGTGVQALAIRLAAGVRGAADGRLRHPHRR